MTGNALHHQYQPDSMRVVASARWLEERTLEMSWVFVETAFRDRVVCRFDGDGMTVERSVNVNTGAMSRPALSGWGERGALPHTPPENGVLWTP